MFMLRQVLVILLIAHDLHTLHICLLHVIVICLSCFTLHCLVILVLEIFIS